MRKLTLDEINALTDDEFDAKCATDVMGWRLVHLGPRPDLPRSHWYRENDFVCVADHTWGTAWRPSRSFDDAMACVRRLVLIDEFERGGLAQTEFLDAVPVLSKRAPRTGYAQPGPLYWMAFLATPRQLATASLLAVQAGVR